MTENDLTNLGFNKVEVRDLESQNGYDYFYYTFDVFENLTLISVDSDRVENEDWYVYNLDWPDQFKLQTKDQVLQFLHSVGHLSEAV
jgi:hypothetical protein